MKCPHKSHVALVDGERFLFLRNDGQIFEPRLTMLDQPELEKTNFSAGVRNQDDAGQRGGNTDLNELAHGAAAAEWLNAQVLSGDIEQLTVIADPKTLGEMRRHYHKELESRIVGELAKDLSGEPIPAVEKALANA
ncbi:protein required for attachment to host cells [Altererythrobacter atlanticus]|uniref:Attachment protein n=1 Tax=Croceibacterium atlanticum TaxID=1267766 RepID=A0A0F7KVG4_9SPHN|nr:host attachment protein [Croceibacterium atlanticum]AKH43654.1 attachment protein [Croceibacterium atlanticum]MBB5733862.1 protein required for attachment to host cells [Croceibacterium atlanticum]